MKVLWRLLCSLAVNTVRAALALFILFEEWGWAPISRLMARIGNLPVFRQIEALIKRLPPYAALALFLVPTLMLLPIKLLGERSSAGCDPRSGGYFGVGVSSRACTRA